jgi:predicted acylesterase/phospholipase RssA
MAEAHDPLVERVVILAEDLRRVQMAREQVSAYMDQTSHALEVWEVHGIETCLSLMDRYLNLIILNYAGQPKDKAIPVLHTLRGAYDGRILLINEDPSLSGCEWGRQHKVDFHLRSVDQLKTTLPRILDVERKRGQTALVLAGGGILGGFNEAGSLKALYDFGIRDFDIYVGISAGSVIGACAANGASPEELIEHEALGLTDFYYPNLREAIAKARSFLPRAVKSVAELLSNRNSDVLFALSGLFTPSAFLSNERIIRKLERLVRIRGGTNNFRILRERGKKLFVLAVDLDNARTRVFGEAEDLEVPITQACAASCALPIAYAPVEVGGRQFTDGAVARTAGIDCAVRNGADLIVCINPLVPYTGGDAGYIKSLGMLGILEQAYRTILQTRLHQTVERYRLTHPHVTIILIEPDSTDPTMFHNPLNASERLNKLSALHGFKSTRKTIDSRFDFIKRCFHYHGRPITREIVDEEFEGLIEDNFSSDAVDRVLTGRTHVFE